MNLGSRCLLLVGLGLILTSQTGCVTWAVIFGQKDTPQLDTSLLEAQGYSIPAGGMPMQVDPNRASDKPSVVLEVRGGDNKRHMESIPLPVDQSIFIEDLVQQAQLHEHIGRLSISIMRPTQGGPPLRMDVRTDDDGKALNVGSNYALYPGDHIIVNDNNGTALQKFLRENFTM